MLHFDSRKEQIILLFSIICGAIIFYMLLCTFQLNKSWTRNWKNLKTAILDYLIYFHLKADTILNMLKCWCPCNNQDKAIILFVNTLIFLSKQIPKLSNQIVIASMQNWWSQTWHWFSISWNQKNDTAKDNSIV